MDRMGMRVRGMTCTDCAATLREQLGALAGVERVEVDLDRETVHVTGSGLDPATVTAAVRRAGYDIVG